MANHILRNAEPWHINNQETAYNVESSGGHGGCGSTRSGSWRVYIPKIMPLISMGTARRSRVSIDTSILVNASSCRPTLNRIISELNYIMADKPSSVGFANPWKGHGMKLEVEVLHNNVDNIRVTNVFDNSHTHPKDDD